MSMADNVSGPLEVAGAWLPTCQCGSTNVARPLASQWGECLECNSEVDCRPPQRDPDEGRE